MGEERRARFEALAAEVWEPLQRFLLRRTDPETAQDVLADALLVLWRRLDDVPAGAGLPWAYGVARGCLANARRAEERRRRLADRLAAEPPGDPDHGARSDVDLESALAALPGADRELLRLWAWEELAPREIAVVLGTSPAVVSVRLTRARGRLKRALQPGKVREGAGQEPGRRDGEGRGGT